MIFSARRFWFSLRVFFCFYFFCRFLFFIEGGIKKVAKSSCCRSCKIDAGYRSGLCVWGKRSERARKKKKQNVCYKKKKKAKAPPSHSEGALRSRAPVLFRSLSLCLSQFSSFHLVLQFYSGSRGRKKKEKKINKESIFSFRET